MLLKQARFLAKSRTYSAPKRQGMVFGLGKRVTQAMPERRTSVVQELVDTLRRVVDPAREEMNDLAIHQISTIMSEHFLSDPLNLSMVRLDHAL